MPINPVTMRCNLTLFSILSLVCCLTFGFSIKSHAQSDRIGVFLKTGRQDAESLTQAYLKPLSSGFGGALNTGWYNTASTHQALGFDIQIRGALAVVPNGSQHFNVNELNLNNTELASGETADSPTAAGDDMTGPQVVVRDNGDEVARFNLPQGSGFQYVPSPMIQASVGLIKHTDIIVRYVPTVHAGSYGDFNMKGVGFKHSLSQWLPGGRLFPVDISIMAGYSHLNINADLNLNPQSDAIPDPDYTGRYDNQKVETSIDNFTAQLMVGKDLPFISVYGAVGYQTSTFNLDVTGDYPIATSVEGVKKTTTISDPFSYSQNGTNKFSLSGGLKLKLFFFHIFGDYTLSKYSVVNAGIGFSFR